VGRRRRGRRGLPDLLGPRAAKPLSNEPAGARCHSSADCAAGLPCLEGICAASCAGTPPSPACPAGTNCVLAGLCLPACAADGDCQLGSTAGRCIRRPARPCPTASGRVRLGRGVPGRQPVRRGEPGLRDHLEGHLHHRLVPALTRAAFRLPPCRRGRSSRRARPGFTVSGPPEDGQDLFRRRELEHGLRLRGRKPPDIRAAEAQGRRHEEEALGGQAGLDPHEVHAALPRGRVSTARRLRAFPR